MLVLFLLMAACGNSVYAQKYIISRRIDDWRNGVYDRAPDVVEIPPSLCTNSTQGETECLEFGGNKSANCECECSSGSVNNFGGTIYNSSTFGFYNGTWKCEDNNRVREHAGCSLTMGLRDARLYKPIATLPSRDTAQHILTTKEGNGLDTSFRCTVDKETTMYMKCDGDWEKINGSKISNGFTIIRDKTSDLLAILVNSSARLGYSLPSGHLIKLGLNCTPPISQQDCIVMKIQGDIQCPASPLAVGGIPVASPTPSFAVSTLRPVSTLRRYTSQPSATVSSIRSSSSTPNQQATRATSSTLNKTAGELTTRIITTSSNPREDDGQEGDNNNIEQVGFVLGGVTLLAVIIMVITILGTKRKVRSMAKKKSNLSTSSTNQIVENDSYEQSSDSVLEFKTCGQETDNAHYNSAQDLDQEDNESEDHVYYNTARKPRVVDHKGKKPFKGDNRSSISNEFYGTIEVLKDQPISRPSTTKPTKGRPTYGSSSSTQSYEDRQSTSFENKNDLPKSVPKRSRYDVPHTTQCENVKGPLFGSAPERRPYNFPKSTKRHGISGSTSAPSSRDSSYNVPNVPVFEIINETNNREEPL